MLEISTILLTSFIFSAISIANGTKGDNSEVKNKRINNSLIIISLILISLFLLPTLYFISTSITSIGKTEIMGNANKFEYNNIDTIYFNLISPSNECDGSTNKTKISCLYQINISVMTKNSEERTLYENVIRNNNFNKFIFSNSDSTKFFLDQVSKNGIKFEKNFTNDELENIDIPEEYKHLFQKL